MDDVKSLFRYLEIINNEVEFKIHQIQVSVSKLQDIYESIRPVEVNTPQENEVVANILNIVKGNSPKEERKPKEQPPSPFDQFQEALKQFQSIKELNRERYSRRFVTSISNYSQKTPAHSINRLLPSVRRLNKELDKILSYNIEQPALECKALYGTERASTVAESFEKAFEDFKDNQKLEFPFKEKEEAKFQKQVKQQNPNKEFEFISDLTPKQFSALYKLRGDARLELIKRRIKEKAEEVLIPLFRKESDLDKIEKLKVASKAFMILTESPQSYALVSDV
ncbi:hypothetical protein GPJ56_003978 [Histomonas meleagridis]|uniref:uncharacterized protein n=1 Tax=Histomonas meleagridis TaxID=135588 RepID=UPI0035593B02|nr:hypothetical protein GPJ56_003978 [Histomonas meleagridis]KAH0798087.1 hypothetical protein GO595_009098 [Histomonas meleagridis]